jgi:hypothetical protein
MRISIATLLLGAACLAVLLFFVGCQSEERLSIPPPPPPDPEPDVEWIQTGEDDQPGGQDSTGIRLTVVAQKRSVLFVWSLNSDQFVKRYQMYRRTSREEQFNPIRCVEYAEGVWADFSVTEGETYQYQLVALGGEDESINSSDVKDVTVRFPESVLRDVVAAYRSRDLALLRQCLAEDYQCRNIRQGGCVEHWDRETEIRIHENMFNPRYPRNTIRELAVDTELQRSESVTINLEPCWRFVCAAHLLLALDPTSSYDGEETVEIRYPTEFVVKRDPNDLTRWVLHSWGDVYE